MRTSTTTSKKSRLGRSAVRQPSDEELLLSYQETGDCEFFNELVVRYERELYNYLRRYLGDAHMAEDVFQQTFLQVHLKCDQFQKGRKLRPWLYTIATNQAIDAIRRNKRHRAISLDRGTDEDLGTLVDLLVGNEPDPMEIGDAVENQQWLRGAIDELPEYLRVVLLMVYFQGLKYRETAEALDIPLGTVKSRMHMAILKLNEAWNATHQDQKTQYHA